MWLEDRLANAPRLWVDKDYIDPIDEDYLRKQQECLSCPTPGQGFGQGS